MKTLIGYEPYGNCWVVVRGYPFISQNSHSYLIHEAYLGIELLIAKSCSHGGILANKLKDGTPPSEIAELMEIWTLLNTGAENMRKAITAAINESYDKGHADKASEFRRLLDLE